MGRDTRHSQPLRRVPGRALPARLAATHAAALPRLRRRRGLPLRVPAAEGAELLPHQGRAHRVRHDGRPHRMVAPRRLRHAGAGDTGDAPQRDTRPLPEGRQLGQQLRGRLLTHRRADLAPDENPGRPVHQPARSRLPGLRHHAPRTGGQRNPRTHHPARGQQQPLHPQPRALALPAAKALHLRQPPHPRRYRPEGMHADPLRDTLANHHRQRRRPRHARLQPHTEPQRALQTRRHLMDTPHEVLRRMVGDDSGQVQLALHRRPAQRQARLLRLP